MNHIQGHGVAHENDDWPEGGIADPDTFPDDDLNSNNCRIGQDIILNQTETEWIGQDNYGDAQLFDIILPRREILKYAYWKVRSIKESENYNGEVFYGKLLRNRCQELPEPQWVDTGKSVAIKRIDYALMSRDRNCPDRPLDEIKAMRHLQRVVAEREQERNVESAAERCLNNHVVTCVDVLMDKKYLYIIMPFCDGGEFFDYVYDNQLTEQEARYWFKQLLDAVELLQRARICHRDISFENTMIHGNNLAILIDFGVSLKIPYTDDGQRCLLRRQNFRVGKVSQNQVLAAYIILTHSIFKLKDFIELALPLSVPSYLQKYCMIASLLMGMPLICGHWGSCFL